MNPLHHSLASPKGERHRSEDVHVRSGLACKGKAYGEWESNLAKGNAYRAELEFRAPFVKDLDTFLTIIRM
jgi:hypothetical protein